MTPRYDLPSTPAPAAYKDYGYWRPSAPQDRAPRTDWWHDYGQAELDQLEADLDQGNPDLQSALARYREARALYAQAQAALYPTVNLVAADLGERQSDNRPLRSASQPARYRDELVGASASYELDLWGRVRSATAAGKAAAQAASADLESVRLILHAELATAYISLRGADTQLRVLQRAVTAYQRARDLIKNRYDGGIASALDLARSQNQLETAQAEATDVKAGRALYEHAIAALTGRNASEFSLPLREEDLSLPSVPVGIPSQLLERRPDVASAERRMAAYNATIGATRAAFFPRLSLSALAGFESTTGAGLMNAPNRFWAIGPQGLLTILDGGYRSAAVDAARARFEAASGQYRSTVLEAFQEVEDALALTALMHRELEQRAAARVSAERALELAQSRYREGAVSYLEVVTAQVAALDSERRAAEIRTRELQASMLLVRALGGGFTRESVAVEP
jgi:NodT family efflux transporter outer membrane factor (OMF) lipoprotein